MILLRKRRSGYLKQIISLTFIIFFLSCKKDTIPTINYIENDIDKTISGYMNKLVDNNITPGLQYIILDEGGIIYSKAAGYSDIKNKAPMKLETTMNIFSVTKLFTAVSILQLHEQQKLNIYDDISTFCEDIPYKNVRIIDILTHTSGIPNPILGNFFIHWKEEHNEYNRDEFLKKILKKKNKLKFKPGKEMAYSNLGYAILGSVIEKCSGLEYENYIKKNIIEKLGINHEDMNFSASNNSSSAKPYIKRKSVKEYFLTWLLKGGKWEREGNWKSLKKQFYFNFPSHGGLISNSYSLMLFLQDLIKQESKLLGKKSKELFFKEINGRVISWFIRSNNENKYYMHEGGGLGYICEVRIYKNKKIASLLMMNTTKARIVEILDALDNEFMQVN